MALRRIEDRNAGGDARVVGLDHLGGGELRAQCGQQRRGGGGAAGKARGLVEKAAAAQVAVHVTVEELQHFGLEVLGGESGHGVSFRRGCGFGGAGRGGRRAS